MNRIERMILNIIKEESSSWMQDGNGSSTLIQDLKKEMQQCYDKIEYSKRQMKSITNPSDNWVKKEYQSVIESTQERIEEIKNQLENIKRLDK